MVDLFRGPRRSSTGTHDLLPAADSRGTIIDTTDTFVSISTLFAWTFGSGAVVSANHNLHHFLTSSRVIVLEDMAGCVNAYPLCHWCGLSRFSPDDNH
jgi:hypothetical protein